MTHILIELAHGYASNSPHAWCISLFGLFIKIVMSNCDTKKDKDILNIYIYTYDRC